MSNIIMGNTIATPMAVPDWNQTDPRKADYIKNKPEVYPKVTNITLLADKWVGDANPWSQVVVVNGVTTNSRVDLRATALQIVELQENDIAFIAENDDGNVTVYALGSRPTVDYILQAEITEVVIV